MNDILLKWFIVLGIVIGIIIIISWILPLLNQLGVPDIQCKYKERTGHQCLFCGMTTSCMLIVRGDITGAFYVNPVVTFLFLSLVVIFVIIGLRLLFVK